MPCSRIASIYRLLLYTIRHFFIAVSHRRHPYSRWPLRIVNRIVVIWVSTLQRCAPRGAVRSLPPIGKTVLQFSKIFSVLQSRQTFLLFLLAHWAVLAEKKLEILPYSPSGQWLVSRNVYRFSLICPYNYLFFCVLFRQNSLTFSISFKSGNPKCSRHGKWK